jgi:SAM-dependent methyltransferase
MDALEDSSFDAAICMFSTLGMIRGSGNRLACVREVFRLLRPGGTFTVHCHNFLFGGYLPETWLEWAKSLGLALLHGYELGDKLIPEYRGVPNMYLHLFTPGEVGRLLSASGLRVVRIAYINRGRTAELGPVMFRSLRANGFVAVSRKPEMG